MIIARYGLVPYIKVKAPILLALYFRLHDILILSADVKDMYKLTTMNIQIIYIYKTLYTCSWVQLYIL